MIKKMAVLLCLLSLIANLVPSNFVFAEEADIASRKAAVLQALGIDDAAASGVANNDYLISAMSGFLYEKIVKPSAEEFARSTGIINYGEVYSGNKTVTKNEAVEYAIATLGYKEYAESIGDKLTLASSLGLTKGMGALGDEAISVDECRVLLYNMLDVEPMAVIYGEGQIKHIIEKGQTLLSKYRNVHRIYGMLTADSMTSLDKEMGLKEGFIQIDNSIYAMDNYSAEDKLLGKNVEAYVMTDTDYEPIALYLGEKDNRNEEIVISARNIKNITDDFSQLEYYENERVKKAKISDVPKVIYNGVFYGGYTKADFKPDAGAVRLIDNNNDGKYDVIFITSYETVIIESVDVKEKAIYYRSEGNILQICLNSEKTDVKYTMRDDTGPIDISDIQLSDVLNVAMSKSSKNIWIEILVSRESITDRFIGIDETDMEIVLGDGNYFISNAFLKFKNEATPAIEFGNTYTFRVDALGNVVCWEPSVEDGYVVMQRAYESQDNDKYYVSYMNLNGEWIDAPIAKKLKVGEFSYKHPEDAYKAIKDIRAQLVKIEFNQKGEIKEIETSTELEICNENKFTKTPFAKYTFRYALKAFSDSAYKCRYYLEDDAKLIIIPKNPDEYRDKNKYEIRDPMAVFNGDSDYTVSLYDIDKYGFSKIVVMKYEPILKNTLFIVSGVSKVAVDDEVRSQIEGYTGDYENMTLICSDSETFKNVKKGDVIKVSLNPEGYVDSYKKLFSLPDNDDTDSTQYTSHSYMAGIVSDVDAVKKRILIKINGTEYSYRINDETIVQKYDPTEGVEKSDIYGIVPQTRIYISASWGNVKHIIIRK